MSLNKILPLTILKKKLNEMSYYPDTTTFMISFALEIFSLSNLRRNLMDQHTP